MQKQLNIGWKVSTLNLALASLRYRAMLPVLALESHGVVNKVFASPGRENLSGFDALVIVKSFTVEDYMLAQEAAALGVPIIFDLCDNIFIEEYGTDRQKSPVEVFSLIASIASAIVVTTEPLAVVVRERVNNCVPVYVVPDGIENEALLVEVRKRLKYARLHEYIHAVRARGVRLVRRGWGLIKTRSLIAVLRERIKAKAGSLGWRFWMKMAYRHYDKVRALLTGSQPKASRNVPQKSTAPYEESESIAGEIIALSPSSRKILWFGNHGAGHASFGMLDLLCLREPLERLAAELPLELVVVSNNRDKFNKYIRSMNISTRYIEWNAASMAQHLRSADVVVIPNSLDPFSICKSANRSVLALSHGVPVVATATPALEQLRECISLDDFEEGVRRYLTDPAYAALHVQKGKERIEELYGQQAIGQLWKKLIVEIVANSSVKHPSRDVELIFVIQLPQDVDLARPLLAEARRRGVDCAVWTCLGVIKRWPEMEAAIKSFGFDWRVFSDELEGFSANKFPRSAYALVTITETSLGPHRFAHRLTRLANSAGIYTSTLQHGYENVGLNYSDDIHGIKHVNFASKRIYIWGHLEALHKDISLQTRKKCFPVGCPKPVESTQISIKGLVTDEQMVIGVFENLHWHRYSDEYRDFFLAGVRYLAEVFPDIVFLVKPHNSGMWLTGRYQGEKPEAKNLIIADPKDPQWDGVSAPQLLGQLTAVITSPSTVAFDAARMELPTAVVAQGLHLENYSPLSLIESLDDWRGFVTRVLDRDERMLLQEGAREFVGRVLLPGNAAARIVEDIVSHKPKTDLKNAS